METVGGHKNVGIVALYEFIGTAAFCFSILVSGENSLAVAFTLFILYNLMAPISGAHVNPAVTLGVYISRCNIVKDAPIFFAVILA